ncbi:DUF2637 domain-containing protein [Streptomyces scabiei]|uniref:DUF2637 domain-containing protein n=1 Tax=Streptomyces scabiei TaxID=1930 RepID=UPI0029ACC40F|nr:DUF2637 domain-containing protein [Streptomyces scabiei]MDX2872016.1 DUF2637 domain-containing protein [Streptomyces scabiei]
MTAVNLQTMTAAQIKSAERTLSGGTWAITAMAITFSLFTVTPLVERVTPDGWKWSAIGLSLLVDVALVIVIRMDAAVSRLGAHVKGWPAVLRWLTGIASVLLNIGDSALKGDLVGVAVHAVAPLVLVAVSEAGPKYRQAITDALDRIERERAAERERERQELREREDRERADREREIAAQRAERERQEAAERERREQAAAEREREREHQARLTREERAHEAELERQRADREDARRREEQERIDRAAREQRDRADRERREQETARKAKEAAQKAERDRKAREARELTPAPVSAAVSTPRPLVSATVSSAAHETAHDTAPVSKMSEADARQAVADAVREGRSQRQVAALTGWSTGWVAKAFKDLEEATAA